MNVGFSSEVIRSIFTILESRIPHPPMTFSSPHRLVLFLPLPLLARRQPAQLGRTACSLIATPFGHRNQSENSQRRHPAFRPDRTSQITNELALGLIGTCPSSLEARPCYVPNLSLTHSRSLRRQKSDTWTMLCSPNSFSRKGRKSHQKSSPPK